MNGQYEQQGIGQGLVEATEVKKHRVEKHHHHGWTVIDLFGRIVGHHASKETAEEQAKGLNK